MIVDMKHKTILKHNDFLTPPDCIVGRSEFFIVKTKLAKYPGDSRYGLVVSKRTFKQAVHRNRAKRLLRDWIAYNEDLMLPCLDYIIIAYDKILDAPRDVGRDCMCKAFKKIARLYRLHGNQK